MANNAISIGNVQATNLCDFAGDFPLSLDQLFPGVPATAWAPYRKRYPESFGPDNRLHMPYCGTLLRSRGRIILLDTGLGPATLGLPTFLKADTRLPEELKATGTAVEEIDTVVISHLHPDHVGWNLSYDGGVARPTFPRARYVAHQADWDTFQRKEVQEAIAWSYVDETITPLQELGVLDLVSADQAITDEITLLHTPGHTPGSVSLLIVSQGERALLTGDAFAHPAQVTEPGWAFDFDFDRSLAGSTRERLLDRIEAEGLTLAACHFPEPGFGKVIRLEGRRYWQAI